MSKTKSSQNKKQTKNQNSSLDDEPKKVVLGVKSSPSFRNFLEFNGCSIGFTSYQTGIFCFVSKSKNGDSLTLQNNRYGYITSILQGGGQFYIATKTSIRRFANIIHPGEIALGRFDQCFAPIRSVGTGALDIHDMGFSKKDGLIFVNTRYNCISKVSDNYSFEPVWMPSFLDKIIDGDRCHLNGMAMVDDLPKYVTVATSQSFENWKDYMVGGGAVIDMQTNEIVCDGLTLPHSPRVHNGQLYIADSGSGRFGRVNIETRKFEPIAELNGFGRGIAFLGDYAVVGLSRPRSEMFLGLPLQDLLDSKKQEAVSGLVLINLVENKIVGDLSFEGEGVEALSELYDVAIFENSLNPMISNTFGRVFVPKQIQ